MARKVFKPVEVSNVVWLTVVWVLLWGDLTWGNIAGGLIIGLMVTQLMPLPRIEFKGHVRVRYLIALITRFLADLISASFQVAIQAFKFGTTPRGAIIGVKLRSESDLYLTLTSELSCLVPGSIVIEADQVSGTLYLHILDLEQYGGEDKVRQDVWNLEARVMRALASRDELDRAGIPLHRGDPVPDRRAATKLQSTTELKAETKTSTADAQNPTGGQETQ